MVEPTINNFSPTANLQPKLSFKLKPPSVQVGIAGASSASCQMNPAISGPRSLRSDALVGWLTGRPSNDFNHAGSSVRLRIKAQVAAEGPIAVTKIGETYWR